MKKFLLSLVLIAIFVLPVRAEKKNMDIVLKGGMYASPYLNLNNNIFDVDLGFTLGAEAFWYQWEKTALGLGYEHLFKTDIENSGQKMSMNNVYFALKYQWLTFEDKEIDSIYLLGQAGLSLADIDYIDAKNLAGICLGGGIGIESNWFIVEVLYTLANWVITNNDAGYTRGFLYSLKINMGYKFSL
ncbi:MAG: hypothetical protein II816_01250 [Elusimicrobia bacterium]|nr:hypothetical protein [Elusimicrobiota bacterium]